MADERLLDIKARVRDDIPAMKDWRTLYFEDCEYLVKALEKERERCAEIAESFDDFCDIPCATYKAIAERIRER